MQILMRYKFALRCLPVPLLNLGRKKPSPPPSPPDMPKFVGPAYAKFQDLQPTNQLTTYGIKCARESKSQLNLPSFQSHARHLMSNCRGKKICHPKENWSQIPCKHCKKQHYSHERTSCLIFDRKKKDVCNAGGAEWVKYSTF